MRGTAQNPGIVGASRSFMQTCPDLWAEVKGKPVFFSPLPHECVFGENEKTSKICAEAVRKEKKNEASHLLRKIPVHLWSWEEYIQQPY